MKSILNTLSKVFSPSLVDDMIHTEFAKWISHLKYRLYTLVDTQNVLIWLDLRIASYTRAQQLLRWATVWPQQTWDESGEGLLWGLDPHWVCGIR